MINALFDLEFSVPLEQIFSLIWRSHHCRWRAANFDLCSALKAIEQCKFFSAPLLLCQGHPFILGISDDPWHSHLMSSVSQWSCHYQIERHRSVAAGIRTPNLSLARRTSPPRWIFFVSNPHETNEPVGFLSLYTVDVKGDYYCCVHSWSEIWLLWIKCPDRVHKKSSNSAYLYSIGGVIFNTLLWFTRIDLFRLQAFT